MRESVTQTYQVKLDSFHHNTFISSVLLYLLKLEASYVVDFEGGMVHPKGVLLSGEIVLECPFAPLRHQIATTRGM